jgi:ABC-type transporter Mla subunit MlaD
MTGGKAITRAELTDDETATLLAEALAGHRLSRRAARQLATSLRRVTGALPAGRGNLAGLSRHLAGAADVLDAQASAPPRRRV